MEGDMSKNNSFISNFKNSLQKENVKFFLKLLLFFVMVMSYLYHMMPQYNANYCASLQDKMERLESIEGAKIVLLGDSNLAFGIQSEIIESEFNMPVVNMGLHRAIGNRFHEEMAKCHVTEGDIYILCHTSYADNGSIGDATLLWSILENHFELWKLLQLSDAYTMLKAYPAYLKKCLDLYNSGYGNFDTGGMYDRSAFNEYGDISLEHNEEKYIFEEPVNPPQISDVTIERINELSAWLESQGAVLLVAAYPIGNGDLTAGVEAFDTFQSELEEKLDCAVISQFTDYMYDYSCFYDTSLHLTSEAAVVRTRQLVEDIERWQESQAK